MDEALRLFADQGYKGTTVTDIERAAGLSPGAGGLYKHFATKEELLRTAVEHRAQSQALGITTFDQLGVDGVAEQLAIILRGGLMLLEADRDLLALILKEGARFPAVLSLARERLIDTGHRWLSGWLHRHITDGLLEAHDTDALAAVLIETLAGHAVLRFILGAEVGDIDEDRLITVLSALVLQHHVHDD